MNCHVNLTIDLVSLTEIATSISKGDKAKLIVPKTFFKSIINPSVLENSKTLKCQTQLHIQIVKRDMS
jgi:hypothetical protein